MVCAADCTDDERAIVELAFTVIVPSIETSVHGPPVVITV